MCLLWEGRLWTHVCLCALAVIMASVASVATNVNSPSLFSSPLHHFFVDACRDHATVRFMYQHTQRTPLFFFPPSRYAECLELFKEFQVLEGNSAQLWENMGHAYNALGEHDEAERCFLAAIDLTERKGGMGSGGCLVAWFCVAVWLRMLRMWLWVGGDT